MAPINTLAKRQSRAQMGRGTASGELFLPGRFGFFHRLYDRLG
jgi:hypothetical protein